jgi:GNAT superfamily N-acetyltransferase
VFISFEQLVILLLLAFVLFGPEKLPEYAEKLGRLVAKLRQASSELSKEYHSSFQPPPTPAFPQPEPISPSLPEVTCPQCHQQLGAEFTFCPHCGRHLNEGPPATPAGPYEGEALIRQLRHAETALILDVINEAAGAYQGVIPSDCWHEPYMPESELLQELAAGVIFWGYEDGGRLLGVMGRQDLEGVTLIRHAYVRTDEQCRGLGARLLAHLCQGVSQPMLVGTWAAAWWAIRFYEKHGFRLVTQEEKDQLLRRFWTITDRQVETSVVLADDKWFGNRVGIFS